MTDRPGSQQLRYEVVDVFAERAFAGNPLAVVLDAEALTTTQMAALASEFNLSETAFPLTSDRADYQLRIFTPAVELPFAGHPSIGAAHTLARLGRIPLGGVVQECRAGLLPLEVDRDGAVLTGGTPTSSDGADPADLLAAAGLDPADVVGTPVRRAGCGLDFHYLHVRREAVARASADPRALAAVFSPSDGGLCLLAWDGATQVAHVRVLCPGVGVSEDPATGSATLGLGVWLADAGLVPGEATTAYEVRQGAEIGRPSLLRGTVQTVAGVATRVSVAGAVVPVASGTIRCP